MQEKLQNLIVVMTCLLLVGSLIGAMILQSAARRAEGLKISFGSAFGTAFLMYGAGYILGIASLSLGAQKPIVSIGIFFGNFLINSAVISARYGLPFNKGAKIAVVMILISLAIGFLVAIIFIIFMKILNIGPQ